MSASPFGTLPRALPVHEAQPGRAQDRRIADVTSAICALGILGVTLLTLPSFFAMHGSRVGYVLAIGLGAGFGYLSAGAHPMSRHTRRVLTLCIWAAAFTGLGVAVWRDPAVRPVLGDWWRDMRYLVIAWSAGATPAVPDVTGWPLLFACAWPLTAFVLSRLRQRSPLPVVAGLLAVLIFEWEFLDDLAGRMFWIAAALGLLWLAAGWARSLAEQPWSGRPPGAVRVLVLAAVGTMLVMGTVALLPLNRPAIDLGALGNWIDRTFPTLAHVEQGTRLTPGVGGGGPARNPGPGGPLSPTSPYTLKMVGFSQSNGSLGGPLTTDGAPSLEVTVVSGTPPPVLYLRGEALDTYTGRGWTESKASLYPSAPPSAPRPVLLGVSPARPPRDTFTLKVQPTGLVTSTLFTALTPQSVTGAHPVWDHLGNAWLAQPLPPGNSYHVTAVAVQTPTRAPVFGQGAFGRPGFGLQGNGFSFGRGSGRAFRGSVQNDLQLPAKLPAQIGALARKWTAGATGPLAEALALQTQLLKIPYSLDAPAPAAGTDFVDQFLFHIQKGYCTYYASAMAVMLRTLGIPARWVVGFRVHTPPTGKTLLVRDTDAHAWVEAFIAPYGWLTFDPTPWGPTLATAAGGSSASTTGDLAPGIGPNALPSDLVGRLNELNGPYGPGGLAPVGSVRLPRSLELVPLAALLAVAAAAAWGAYRDRWDARDPVGSARRLWALMERVASRNGRPRMPAATAAEFAADLDVRWPKLQGAAGRVAAAYGRLRFGPPPSRTGAAVELRDAWLAVDAVWRAEAPVGHWMRRLF